MHWLSHWLGLDDASGPIYLFFSGIFADLTYLSVIGGMAALVRKHQCEVHGCWRMGKHVTEAQHTVCRHHHPELWEHDGKLTPWHVFTAHQDAKDRL